MHWLDFREPVSAWTHCLWFLLSLPAGLVLWRLSRRDRIKQVGFLVFSLSMAACYGASTLFHGLCLPRNRLEVFAKLDSIVIFLFIAGTMTPVALIVLRGHWQRGMLASAWLTAAGGIGLCLAFEHLPRALSTGLYLTMGWGVLLCYFALTRSLSHRAMRPAVLGGVCYSVGAVFNLLRWPVLYPGVFAAHEVFHLCVMAGTLAHFWFLVKVIAPFEHLPESLLDEEGAGAGLTPAAAEAV